MLYQKVNFSRCIEKAQIADRVSDGEGEKAPMRKSPEIDTIVVLIEFSFNRMVLCVSGKALPNESFIKQATMETSSCRSKTPCLIRNLQVFLPIFC